ncbi:putative cytochrome P450 12a5, mitochondrial [Haemaphysalis longicornis]
MLRVSASRPLLKLKPAIGAFPKGCATLSDKMRVMHVLLAKDFSKLPRIRCLPLVGTSWLRYPLVGIPEDMHEAAWQMYRRYGPVAVEENPGRETIVHLFSAEDFRFVFRYEGKVLYRLGLYPLKAYKKARGELSPDYGVSNGDMEEWGYVQRWTPHPTFQGKDIESYAGDMGQISDDTLKLIDAFRDGKGEVDDCYVIMQRWSLESAIVCALNKRLGLLEPKLSDYSDASMILRCTGGLASVMNQLAVSWPLTHHFNGSNVKAFKRISSELAPILLKLFKEAIVATPSEATRKNDRIVRRLPNNLNVNEMLPFVYEFLVANTYMASAAATFCLYRLAMHPEAQEKARQEVFSAVGESREEHLPANLPYLYACIRESLRLHPMVHEIYKKVYVDFVASDHIVPANTLVRTVLSVGGRLEENFPKASEFLPERWLRTDESEKVKEVRDAWIRHQFASIPLNMGPAMRNRQRIIELELLILLGKVLRKYRVENDHGDIGYHTRFLSMPKRSAKFRFVELETST